MAWPHDPASELLAAPSAMALERHEPAPSFAADPLSDVLRMVKLTGALFFLVDASTPWGVEVPRADAYAAIILPRAQHIVSYHIILEGSGWMTMPGLAPSRFDAGDILVMPHEDAYSMLSAPDQPPEYDAAASVQFFGEMAAGKLPFVVEEGGGGPSGAQFVCGFLGCDMQPFNPVIRALPRLLHVRRPRNADSLLDRLVELTLSEAQVPRVGGDCVRLRLGELMFVEVVRSYLETLPAGQTGWLSGLRDPVVGRVLALLHDEPARPWTLRELAERAGVSRAVLAERFAHLVGCPPMHYLTQWRMQVAARLLADSAAKVAAVAHDVGYESESAFSRAFKKTVGIPPARWRSDHGATAAGHPRLSGR